MTKWDKEYIKLCKKILSEGVEVENRTGVNTIKIPGYFFEFDLEKEFPFLTTKKLYYKAAIKEIHTAYHLAMTKLYDKCRECLAILVNCETFEQKMTVLQKYDIIDSDYKLKA